MPDAQAGLFDNHHGIGLESRRSLGKANGKPLLNPRGASVLQPEKDDPGGRPAGQGHDLAEIEIEGQEDAAFPFGEREDVRIGEPLQAAVEEMDSVMATCAQPRHDAS